MKKLFSFLIIISLSGFFAVQSNAQLASDKPVQSDKPIQSDKPVIKDPVVTPVQTASSKPAEKPAETKSEAVNRVGTSGQKAPLASETDRNPKPVEVKPAIRSVDGDKKLPLPSETKPVIQEVKKAG